MWRASRAVVFGLLISILKKSSAAASATPTGTASSRFKVEKNLKACSGNHGGAIVEADTTPAASASRASTYARAFVLDLLIHTTTPKAATAYHAQRSGETRLPSGTTSGRVTKYSYVP